MRIGHKIKFLPLVAGLILLPAFHSQAPTPFAQRTTGKLRDLVRRRQDWFYNQRAYPLGYIPAGARLKALHQLDQMVRTQKERARLPSAARAAQVAASTAWTPIGPQPTLPSSDCLFTDCVGNGFPTDSGRVTALAVDPRDATGNTVYLGAAEGGVWVTTNGGQSWTPLTDSQPSLAIGSIALDPTTNPTTVYVGTGEENFSVDSYYGAGVLKSANGGQTWTQDSTFTPPSGVNPVASGPFIGALAVNPKQPSTVLAAVETTDIFGVSTTVHSGIWQSTDFGAHWTRVLPAGQTTTPFAAATDVLFDPSDATGQTAYAALGSFPGDANNTSCSAPPCNGVFKSTNAGATWSRLTAVDQFAGTSGFGRISLAIGPPVSSGTPGVLLVAIAEASGFSKNLLGLFETNDGGSTWKQLINAPNFCGGNTPDVGQCFYDIVVRIGPTNQNLIYAGGNNSFGGTASALTVSTDGGLTWSPDLYAGGGIAFPGTNPNGQLHTDTHAIAFSSDGTKMYVGNDGGAWLTTNVGATAGVNWTDLNTTLNITQFYPGISIFPGNPNLGFGGTQDNGTQAYKGNVEWQGFICGDGAYTTIAAAQPTSTLYAACAADEGIFKIGFAASPFAITSITPALNGIGACSSVQISNCYQADFVPPLVLDPENPQTLYFGTNVINQTTDGANLWTPISQDLTGGVPDVFVTTIAVASSDSNTVYAGTGTSPQATTGTGRVWVTKNAGAGSGASFSEVDSGLPKRAVTQVAVDPHSPSTAYVVFSGFSSCSACDQLGHIFQTKTGGGSWANISGNLPDIPVNDLVVDPVINATLYAATDIGVFSTSDGGHTWSSLVSGLPRVAVLGLRLDPQSRVLWAATHGRGVWALQLSSVALGSFNLSPNPTNVNIAAAGQSSSSTITLTGTGGFASSVSFTCSVSPLPVNDPPACFVNPSSVALSATATTATATLRISTTAGPGSELQPTNRPKKPGYLAASAGLALACIFLLGVPRPRKRWAASLGLVVLVFLGVALSSCGGHGGSSQISFGTPSGGYTVTVIASGGGTTQTTNVAVTVQ